MVGAAISAQQFRSTVAGQVLDGQGAVIAGTKVVLTGLETGTKYEAESNAAGEYVIPFVAPGSYRLEGEAKGFKRVTVPLVVVKTNERATLDLKLELGQVSETIEVKDEVPVLQTASASVGQAISSQQIENMPMNGRTPLVLAQLAFGVIPNSDPRFFRPFDNFGPSQFSIGGAPGRTNELLLDGAPNTTTDRRVAYNPPADAVSEVKVETFQSDAAYGHTAGGTVNILLKSGTNKLHGSAYEFNQVSNLAANQFFSNRSGARRPTTRFNQWGLTTGGPVMIPKVFDGRNKLFFFFAYEGVKDALPTVSFTTVPTEAQRRGDLSALLGAGPAYQVYDPLSGVREGGRVRRTPFAGNVIPAQRLNPISRRVLDLYPLPNQPGRIDGRDNLFVGGSGERNSFDSHIGRLDWNVSDRHKVSGHIRRNLRQNKPINWLGYPTSNVAGQSVFKRENWGTNFDDVYTFTPTLVLNTRASWTRFIEGNQNPSEGFDLAGLGMAQNIIANAQLRTLPQFGITNMTGVGVSSGDVTPQDVFQIFSSLTKSLSKHSIKAGVDLRQYRESSINYGDASGRFVFGSQWANGPLDNSPTAPVGQDLTALLLGFPTDGNFDRNAFRTNQANYWGVFIQDDYRIRRNLTLNLGVRFEHSGPTRERFDRTIVGFDTTTSNPLEAAARGAYARSPIPEIAANSFQVRGGPLFASASNRNIYNTPAVYASPRLGFAWSPEMFKGNTVIRGGFGIFVAGIGTTGVNQPGFSQNTPMVASLDGFLTPNATIANPFPGGIEQPSGSSLGLLTFAGRGLGVFTPQAENPRSYRAGFTIQQKLAADTVLEIGYMANRATGLTVDRQINFVPEQYFSASGSRDQAVIDRNTAQVANPFAGLVPRTGLNGGFVARNQLLRPMPQFSGIGITNENVGSSYLHMLQARLERRFRSGLQLLANYQWSKLMERRSRLNEFDQQLEKRIASEDRPMRLVLSTSYELPLGSGKSILGNANGAVQQLVGGWVVNGIATFQPGAPLEWGNVIYLGGDLNMNPTAINGAFDTSRFNRTPAQQLDWNVRRFPTRFANLRQDGARNVDLSVIKNFPVFELFRVQFRAEAFNAFNTPTFNAPNLSPTSSTFGLITSQANIARRVQLALRVTW